MATRVTRVDLGEIQEDVLVGRNIDAPKAGEQTDGASVQVIGWAAGITDTVVELVLTCNGRFWRTVPLAGERPDLSVAFPEMPHAAHAGFRTHLGLRGMSRADVGIHAKLQDGSHVHLATIGLERVASTESPPISAVGTLDLGDLRRLEPVSRNWGFERGLPIDRHYIESFLDRSRADVRGHALEIGDDAYSRRFGGDRVHDADVLDIDPNNVIATFVADLTDAPDVPSDRFDVAIVTQVLQFIYDIQAAVRTLHRVLAPGGTLLATFPGISPIGQDQWTNEWSWGLTVPSARRLFEGCFAADDIHVESFGNVLTASAFVQGLAVEDLIPDEISAIDPAYPVIIAVRATKPPKTKPSRARRAR